MQNGNVFVMLYDGNNFINFYVGMLLLLVNIDHYCLDIFRFKKIPLLFKKTSENLNIYVKVFNRIDL